MHRLFYLLFALNVSIQANPTQDLFEAIEACDLAKVAHALENKADVDHVRGDGYSPRSLAKAYYSHSYSLGDVCDFTILTAAVLSRITESEEDYEHSLGTAVCSIISIPSLIAGNLLANQRALNLQKTPLWKVCLEKVLLYYGRLSCFATGFSGNLPPIFYSFATATVAWGCHESSVKWKAICDAVNQNTTLISMSNSTNLNDSPV